MSDRRYRGALALLALCSAAAAVGVHHWLFPLFSLNRDDSVYVAMAELLQQGQVTYPSDFAPFRPWASAVVGERIVFKYSPPWPAVLALADVLAGATWVALGAVAAAVVVLTATLTTEVFADRTTGLVAGVLLAMSPVFVLQSATYLPYVFQLALGLGAVVLLLRGVRRGSTVDTVASGAVMGIAGWARPFDALLVIGPFLVFVVLDRRAGRRPWWGTALRVAAGAVPVLAAILVYNTLVLGGPLRLPYTVTGPQDGFGFGMRGVFPQFTSLFTVEDGIGGTVGNLTWLPSWTFGGVVLIALALIGMVRRARGAALALAVLVVVVPLGYLPFWGPWAISEVWDGVEHFGPFYHLALLIPVVAFAAVSLVEWARSSRSAARRWWHRALPIAAVAMVALTVTALPDKVAVNLTVRDDFRALQQVVDDADLGRAVLLLPRRGDLGFDSTSPFLQNRPDLDQPVLYAETTGGGDVALVDRFPDRALYRLSEELPAGRTTGGTLRLDRLRVDAGTTVTVEVAMSEPGGGAVRYDAYLYDGARETSIPLGPEVTVTLAAPAAPDPLPAGTLLVPSVPGTGVLAVGLQERPVTTDGSVRRWEQRIAYRVTDGGTRVELLRPGQGWSLNATPGSGWQVDVTGDVVRVQ